MICRLKDELKARETVDSSLPNKSLFEARGNGGSEQKSVAVSGSIDCSVEC